MKKAAVLFAAGVFAWWVSSSCATGAPQLRETDKDSAGVAESEPDVYREMIRAGAKTLVVDGRKPFLVYWVPRDFTRLQKRRILTALHGTNGNAYRHLANYLETAKKHKFGVLSVQWGWPLGRTGWKGRPAYRYIPDPRATYSLIAAGLNYLDERYQLTPGECAWLGFSRSSTQCAVFAHLDKNEGRRFFRLFIAASGGVGKNQPLMRELFSGKHGDKPLTGQHFYLWGGERDPAHCEGMKESKDLVEQLGGTVDVLRLGPEGHGGFNHNLQYQEEAWKLWDRLCAQR